LRVERLQPLRRFEAFLDRRHQRDPDEIRENARHPVVRGRGRDAEAAFYLWLRTPIADTQFAKTIVRAYNVTVVPGSYLAREAHGINPGRDFIRVALWRRSRNASKRPQRLKAFYSQFAIGKNKNDGFAVSHR